MTTTLGTSHRQTSGRGIAMRMVLIGLAPFLLASASLDAPYIGAGTGGGYQPLAVIRILQFDIVPGRIDATLQGEVFYLPETTGATGSAAERIRNLVLRGGLGRPASAQEASEAEFSWTLQSGPDREHWTTLSSSAGQQFSPRISLPEGLRYFKIGLSIVVPDRRQPITDTLIFSHATAAPPPPPPPPAPVAYIHLFARDPVNTNYAAHDNTFGRDYVIGAQGLIKDQGRYVESSVSIAGKWNDLCAWSWTTNLKHAECHYPWSGVASGVGDPIHDMPATKTNLAAQGVVLKAMNEGTGQVLGIVHLYVGGRDLGPCLETSMGLSGYNIDVPYWSYSAGRERTAGSGDYSALGENFHTKVIMPSAGWHQQMAALQEQLTSMRARRIELRVKDEAGRVIGEVHLFAGAQDRGKLLFTSAQHAGRYGNRAGYVWATDRDFDYEYAPGAVAGSALEYASQMLKRQNFTIRMVPLP